MSSVVAAAATPARPIRRTAAGAGGGAFARHVNITWTAAQTCAIGGGGTGGQTDNALGAAGGDTWVRVDGGGTAPANINQGILAKGATAGANVNTAGTGGALATSIGSTKFAGGNGGTTANTGVGAGGGGGAGGPGRHRRQRRQRRYQRCDFGSGSGGGANGGGSAGVNNTAAATPARPAATRLQSATKPARRRRWWRRA
jgi:hypothetical protein